MVVVSTFFFGRWRWPQRYLRTTELPMEQCRLQRAVATWRVAGCELFYLLLPTGGARAVALAYGRRAATRRQRARAGAAAELPISAGRHSVQPSAQLFGEGLPAMEHRYSNFNQHRSLCTTTAHTDHRLLWLRELCTE